MDCDPLDYVEDWRNYWSFKSDQREWMQIKNAARNPVKYYLVVNVNHLSPDSGGYDWDIKVEQLRQHPDNVLEDCRKGFAEFVEESDIDKPDGKNYDIIPIHLENYTDYYLSSSPNKLFESPNTLTQFSASIKGDLKRVIHPTSVIYRCPAGHHTRIVNPIYQYNTIDVCGKDNCNNSVFPISKGTTTRNIVEFKVEFHQGRSTSEEMSIDCVATGLHTKDRNLSNLMEADRIRLIGILRNVVIEGRKVNPIFESLYLDNTHH